MFRSHLFVLLTTLSPFRDLRHLKLNVKNKAHVEGSICNAYIVEEASNFCTHYFEPQVMCRSRNVPRNDDGGNVDDVEGYISIFKHPGRFYSPNKSRMLEDVEYKAAHTFVLLNCEEVSSFVR